MTSDLTEFLLARIAEDEAAAKVASRFPTESSGWLRGKEGVGHSYIGFHDKSGSPARVLAECEAKRRIIDDVWIAQWSTPEDGFPSRPLGGQGGEVYYDVLWHLASVYSDHPDFREEWRP